MATAKKTATPATKSSSRALTLWEQKMADAAKQSAKSERAVSGLQGISIKGGVLTVDEQPVPGNELRVVVLVSMHENQYYTKPYDPNNPAIPDCYSFSDPDGDDPEGAMAPHEESKDKQGDDNGLCANCWANQMQSAAVGRGKACKNVRRLALVADSDLESPEALRDAEVRVLKVPVMSVKGWALYVRNVLNEQYNRPHWGVVTLVKVVPDPKSQWKVLFSFEELIDFDDKLFDALQTKIAQVKPQLSAPYIEMEAPAAPPPRGRGRPAPAPAPRGRQAPPAPAPAPRGKPVVPVGRAAQAMAKAVAGAPAKKAKY